MLKIALDGDRVNPACSVAILGSHNGHWRPSHHFGPRRADVSHHGHVRCRPMSRRRTSELFSRQSSL